MEKLNIYISKIEKVLRILGYKIGIALELVLGLVFIILDRTEIIFLEDIILKPIILVLGLSYIMLLLIIGLIWIVLNAIKSYILNKSIK
jgi:hypothetical protein